MARWTGSYFDPEPVEPEPDKLFAYVCPVCGDGLDLADVFRVEMHGLDLVRITYWCPVDGLWHVARYPRRQSALLHLFGELPTLPWVALTNEPHLEGVLVEYVEGEPPPTPKERDVRTFVDDLAACESGADVLNRMRGPRSHDADIVTEHRRRRRRGAVDEG